MTESVWSLIAAPIPPEEIQWRQDGKATARGAKFVARFVAYIDAQFVRARLDSVAPGNWHLSLEMLPLSEGGEPDDRYAFKARLTIIDPMTGQRVEREDVGTGKDYKSASSDAFKRAAVRFGVAHELYAYEQNWVEVDSDGKYAKPVQDPAEVYRKHQAKHATPQRAPQAQVPANPLMMPFGKHKGQPVAGMSGEDLTSLRKWINDPVNPKRAVDFKALSDYALAILTDRSLGQDEDSAVNRMVEAEDQFSSELPFVVKR